MDLSEGSAPSAIVGIGASAGGLPACVDLLKALSPSTGMAFVVIQHLAAHHDSLLAPILGRATSMRVVQVTDEPYVEPNCVYVIPPNRTIVISDGRLGLAQRKEGVPRSVDIFFNSLAESHGHRAIGVILSGTGADGTLGLEAIRAAGGITFAQDQTAEYQGMPQHAVDSGSVDFVLSAAEIASEIAKLAVAPRILLDAEPPEVAAGLEAILDLVRRVVGVDFSQYKTNTLIRRVRRRMALQKLADLDEYKQLLTDRPREVEALYQDILISVTNFFRNPESFEALKRSVLPRLFDRGRAGDPLRVWVLGCSTGEEAYSLAILLYECMQTTGKRIDIAVFATDINNTSIERARRGWYPKSIEQDVSAERLAHFFIPVDGGYCVSKIIRELCVFARHNSLTDPPFSRIDLVSCRNVLIYLQPDLQQRLLPMVHYSLKPHGVLFLGPSETISHHRDLFEVDDARHKIYSKLPARGRLATVYPSALSSIAPATQTARRVLVPTVESIDIHRELDRALLKHYGPAAVVINEDGEVLQFRGNTDPYLTRPEGKPSLNIIKMGREGLLSPLSAILSRIKHQESVTHETGVSVKGTDGLLPITLTVIPLAANETRRSYCILFEPDASGVDAEPGATPRRVSKAKYVADADRQIRVLTQELAATRAYLESTVELQQASNEELQSANEEVQSTNEELQSTNEELETSKEEIQSSNEELTTVNEELRVRNDELDRANNDLNNLFSSVQMAIVMVWRDMRIRRFTPLAQKIGNLMPSDIGRSIHDINLNLEIPNFPVLLQEVIEQGVVREIEIRGSDGHFYLMRVRPYTTEAQQIDGAVIALIDIDVLSRTQESLRRRVDELAAADRNKNEFLAILAHELRNPLAPLRNAVQILKASPRSEEVSAKARDLIERQVSHMSRMVNDLLDAARAERGQINLQRESVDLRIVAERASDSIRPQFEQKRQALHVVVPAEPVVVDGDPIRLDQVVTNLLSNANKYTGENGTIEIRVEPIDRDGESPAYAVLRVSDNGQGIEAELIPHLFELFSQADRSLAHSQGGLGIGLSLVQTLAKLHGGTVAARSAGRDLGSEFVLRIPASVAPVEPRERENSAAAIHGTHRAEKRVLIVDDNVDISESCEILLTMAGHTVQTAGTGRAAIEAAARFKPTVVLLDIGLPDISGYEVAKQIRKLPNLSEIRLIAVSGYDTVEARARSLEAGFDHHVCKPISLDTIESLIN